MTERKGLKALEVWARRMTADYPGVSVHNMTTSWRDGLAFCALIHRHRPDLIDFSALREGRVLENNELAFRVAERHLGIPALLDAEDMLRCPVPDRLSILTYLSQFYQAFGAVGGSPTRIPAKRPPTDLGMVPPPSASPPSKTLPCAPPDPTKAAPAGGPLEACTLCGLPVYLAQRLRVSGRLHHRACFRCARCGRQLAQPGAGCYETEVEGEYCCETCPDEETFGENGPTLNSKRHKSSEPNMINKSESDGAQKMSDDQVGTLDDDFDAICADNDLLTSADVATVLSRSLSDEEKSQGLQKFEDDKYSADFEALVEGPPSNLESLLRAHDVFGRASEPPDVTKKKPDPETPQDDSRSAVPSEGPPSVHNVSLRQRQHHTTAPADNVTKESRTSLVRERLKAFERIDAANARPFTPKKSVVETISVSSGDNPVYSISSDDVDVSSVLDSSVLASSTHDSSVFSVSSTTDVDSSNGSLDIIPKPSVRSDSCKLAVSAPDDNKTKVPDDEVTSPKIVSVDVKPIVLPKPQITPDIDDDIIIGTVKTITSNSGSAPDVSSLTPTDDISALKHNIVESPVDISSPEPNIVGSPVDISSAEPYITSHCDLTPTDDISVPKHNIVESPVDISSPEPNISGSPVDISSPEPHIVESNDITSHCDTAPDISSKPIEMPNTGSPDDISSPKPNIDESPAYKSSPTDDLTSHSESALDVSSKPIETSNTDDTSSPAHNNGPTIDVGSANDLSSSTSNIVLAADTSSSKDDSKTNQSKRYRSTENISMWKTAHDVSVYSSAEALNARLEAKPYPPKRSPKTTTLPPIPTQRSAPKVEYPKELNPFGDDEEEVDSIKDDVSEQTSQRLIMPEDDLRRPLPVPRPLDVSNPFSSDEEEVGQGVGDVQAPRRKIQAPRISLNPFWSDGEEPEEEAQKPVPLPRITKTYLGTPEPKPRTSTTTNDFHGSNSSLSSLSSTFSQTPRKKKQAPLPPTPKPADGSPDLKNTSTGRLRKNRKAPLPPSSTPVKTPEGVQLNVSGDNTTGSKYFTPDALVSSDVENEKSSKDEKNRNRQSQNIISASSDTETSSNLSVPNKSTYGKWKRRKGPAPSRPIPQRRHIKQLPLQEIKHELDVIEMQQQGLERQGVKLEQLIREKCERPDIEPDSALSLDVEEMILELFELVNEKNELFRRQAELMYLKRQQRLEEEYADLEYQIHCLMDQPERNKTDSDKAKEEELIKRLVEVVERRNEIVDCLEMDRVRETEEDNSINAQMTLLATKRDEEDTKLDTPIKLSKKEKKKLKKDKKCKDKGKNSDVDKDIDETESVTSKTKKKKKWF